MIARKVIDNMESDDAADLLGELGRKQEEVLQNIEDVEQGAILWISSAMIRIPPEASWPKSSSR
jgi:hypothetical protein